MTDTEADTFGHHYIKVPVGDFMTMAQRAQSDNHPERKPELPMSLIGRIVCWSLAGALTLTAFVLSVEYWTGTLMVIAWFGFLGMLSFVGALTIQTNVNQRRIMKMADEAREELRDEFRASRPAEQADLAQLTALVDALAAQVRQANTTVTTSHIQLHARLAEMSVEIGKVREHQSDLERDIAAIILGQQAVSQSNGNGSGSVIQLRSARPEGYN